MSRLIKIYLVFIFLHLRYLANRKRAFVVYTFNSTFAILIMFIWIEISKHKSINGYTANDFIIYYIGVVLVWRVTSVIVNYEIEYLISNDFFVLYLVKPVNFIHYVLPRVIAEHGILFLIFIPLIFLILVHLRGLTELLPVSTIALFTLCCIVGFLLEFFAQYIISGFVFWTTHSQGVVTVYEFTRAFLGGYVVPFQILPHRLAEVLIWLPFQSSVALPVEILIGQLGVEQVVKRLGIAVFWMLLAIAGSRRLWQIGLRKFMDG